MNDNDVVSKSNEIWRRIASFWDRHIDEGNDFQMDLIMPVTDRLLALKPGERVLDVACGNGNYSRRLARAGAKVVAIDVAEIFIERAKERTKPQDGPIDYHVMDATNEAAMLSLGIGGFDAIVSSMALMDLPTIRPLMQAAEKLLSASGRFVFSIAHPCFNSNRIRRTAELINEDGKVQQVYGVHVREYLTEQAFLTSGILNQPEAHYYFHRPLSALFRECFAAGFVVDALEEPAFEWKNSANSFSWEKRPEIPPATVVRLKKNVLQNTGG